MISPERTKNRLDQLHAKGEALLRTTYQIIRGGDVYVNLAAFQEWKIGCRIFLRDVFGEGMELREFEEATRSSLRQSAETGLAVLRAFKEHLDYGALGRLEEYVSAALYSDFLGTAESLLSEEHDDVIDMAAFLIGTVLENGLRKIASGKVEVKESDNISSLNSKLANAKVYNNLWRKKIEVWNVIRSNADHGRFGRNKASDVRGMLEGVRDFLSQSLGGS